MQLIKKLMMGKKIITNKTVAIYILVLIMSASLIFTAGCGLLNSKAEDTGEDTIQEEESSAAEEELLP